ncbi:MAG: hypothetical protein QHH00_05605 [Methanomassiliicoccales archaeon]|nr:hypothetical protein [Methanomassiliicoccales archaeon]
MDIAVAHYEELPYILIIRESPRDRVTLRGFCFVDYNGYELAEPSGIQSRSVFPDHSEILYTHDFMTGCRNTYLTSLS